MSHQAIAFILEKIELVTRIIGAVMPMSFLVMFMSAHISIFAYSLASSVENFVYNFPNLLQSFLLAGSFVYLGLIPVTYLAKKRKDIISMHVGNILMNLGYCLATTSLFLRLFFIWHLN